MLFGPSLQRTVGATEAFYLLARKAFDGGYRRLEWKCDNLNDASKRAAVRLGHTFEGVFRQHMIIKDKNRDSAWFSILDKEWPLRKEAFEKWIDASNFTEDGKQKKDLATMQKEIANKQQSSRVRKTRSEWMCSNLLDFMLLFLTPQNFEILVKTMFQIHLFQLDYNCH